MIQRLFNPLKQSFRTLNKTILPVIMVTFIESWNPVIAFHVPQPWANMLTWPEFICIFYIKIILTAFAYGYLTEHASVVSHK